MRKKTNICTWIGWGEGSHSDLSRTQVQRDGWFGAMYPSGIPPLLVVLDVRCSFFSGGWSFMSCFRLSSKTLCPYVRLKHTPNRLIPEQSYRQGCSGRCPVSPTLRRVCCGCGTSNHTHLAASNCVLIENFPCILILCKWAWDNIGDTHYLCSGVARCTDRHLHDDTDSADIAAARGPTWNSLSLMLWQQLVLSKP